MPMTRELANAGLGLAAGICLVTLFLGSSSVVRATRPLDPSLGRGSDPLLARRTCADGSASPDAGHGRDRRGRPRARGPVPRASPASFSSASGPSCSSSFSYSSFFHCSTGWPRAPTHAVTANKCSVIPSRPCRKRPGNHHNISLATLRRQPTKRRHTELPTAFDPRDEFSHPPVIGFRPGP